MVVYKRALLLLLFLALTLVLSLSGCAHRKGKSGTLAVARQFVRGFTSGDVEQELDAMCSYENSGVVVAVDVNWERENYTLIDNASSKVATIRVQGRMRFTLTQIKKFAKSLGVEIPRVEAGTQIGVNFDGFSLAQENGEWCVPRSTKDAFYNYVWEQVLDNLESTSSSKP